MGGEGGVVTLREANAEAHMRVWHPHSGQDLKENRGHESVKDKQVPWTIGTLSYARFVAEASSPGRALVGEKGRAGI